MTATLTKQVAAANVTDAEPDVYDTLIMLFTHRHSKDLHDRQISTIHRLCKKYKEGFFVNDLRKLNQILGFVSALISEGVLGFVPPTCEILRVSCQQFVKETASEEYRNFSHICETIMLIGRFLGSPDLGLQIAAGQMLVTYASTPYVEDGQSAPVPYHHQIIDEKPGGRGRRVAAHHRTCVPTLGTSIFITHCKCAQGFHNDVHT